MSSQPQKYKSVVVRNIYIYIYIYIYVYALHVICKKNYKTDHKIITAP